MRALSEEVKAQDAAVAAIEQEWNQLLLSVPNIPDASVPAGNTEADNVVVSKWGETADNLFPHAKPHWDISWFEKAVDFAHGVIVTGAGFPFYVGDMARLVRSLIAFWPLFISTTSSTGTRIWPKLSCMPFLWMRSASVRATLFSNPE